MAITIVNNPPNDSSLHDEIWITASSTNAGTTNFKFVFDIKINGTTVSRSKIFPNPTDTYGYFNAAPILRSFMTTYFEPSGSSILVASNSKNAVAYNLEIREEASGGIPVLPDASANFVGWNFYYPAFSDLYASGNVTLENVYTNALANYKDNFLTERDINDIKIKFGDKFFVSYLKYEHPSYTAYVRTLNEAGSVVASYNAALSMTGSFNLFNLSASSINTWAGSTLITENTYAYEFYIVSSGGSSRVLRLQHDCSKYTSYNVHFLNRLGGYDTFNFSLVNRKSVEVERENFTKADWQQTSGRMQTWDAYNRYNETKVPYSVRHKNKIRLTSDWVSEINYNWLEQLVASTNAYLEAQSFYLPLYITNNNYEYKISGVDKLFNLEIEAEIPKNINAFR